MVQDDRTMVVAVAAFADDFPSAADYATPPPQVGPPPAQLQTVGAAPGVPEIALRTALAPVVGRACGCRGGGPCRRGAAHGRAARGRRRGAGLQRRRLAAGAVRGPRRA